MAKCEAIVKILMELMMKIDPDKARRAALPPSKHCNTDLITEWLRQYDERSILNMLS